MADSILDVKDILNEYSRDIQNGMEEAAKMVSKESSRKLKDTKGTYKVRSGNYNKGWGTTVEKGRMSISCYIHNKKNAGLTHLLENGHKVIGRNGSVIGQSKAFSHIAPVDEAAQKEYEQDIVKLIENGG